jgi:integrase
VYTRLKGVNSKTKTLADGTVKTYWWAWKGGPPLTGEPGSREFIASYNEAIAKKVQPPAGSLLKLIREYEETSEFGDLAPRTKRDYRQKLALIEKEFGDFPIAALSDPGARGEFKDWRDKLAKRSKRQADYAWVVLARVLSVAKDRGKISVNPCEKGGRLYAGSRRDQIWTLEDESAFLEMAPAHMHLPFLLAIWTGQRQGDLLRLPWSGYDGSRIRLKQSKTGARVAPPVGAPLKVALDDAAKRKKSTVILTNSSGSAWTEHGFRSSWRKACAKAGVEGLTFHDLRGTAVTRLALAGSTEAEIAMFTGHSLNDVRDILTRHYLSHDPALADSAVTKLENWSKGEQRLPTELPTGPVGSQRKTRKAE